MRPASMTTRGASCVSTTAFILTTTGRRAASCSPVMCGARAAAFAAVAAPGDDPAKAVRAREGEMEGFWAPHAT